MTNILITGGAGFIGRNLIRVLATRNFGSVTVIDNESLGHRKYIADFDVEFISGDICDNDAIESAMRGKDLVVHLAADTRVMDSIANPRKNFNNNVTGSFNVLSAAMKFDVSHVVVASTGGAILGDVPPPINEGMLPQPTAPYGASKLSVEAYCSAFQGAFGLGTSALRFSNIYGPGSFHKGSVVAHFYKQILNRKPVTIYGDGSQTRDFLYIDDLCDGIISVLEKRAKGVFQLGSGEPTTLKDLLGLMHEVVGSENAFEEIYENFRQGEVHRTWCDITKAKTAFAFDPPTTLRKGLGVTWDWFQRNAAAFGDVD